MSKSSSLVKNTLILGFGRLATQLSAFLLLPVYTIFLSPDEFGVIDLITVYITLFVPLLMLQLDRAAFRELITSRGDKNQSKKIISNTLRIILPLVAAALVLYSVIASFIDLPNATLIAAAVIATIISTLSLQFARGLDRNDVYAKASVVTGLTNFGVATALIVGLRMGIDGVLVSIIVANLLASLYVFFKVHMAQYISLSQSVVDRNLQKDLIQFAWPLVPSAISWWFIRTFDRTLVSLIAGLAANGVYAAANKYALIFNSLYGIFDMSWTESASEHIDSKERDSFFTGVYNKSFKFFTALAVGLILITPFIFHILIGEEFAQAQDYIPLLIIGGLLNALVAQYSVIYIAKKLTKQVLVTSVAAAVISVLLNVVLIQYIGALGASISLVITFLVMAVWRHYDIKKYVNVKFERLIFVKIAALLIVSSALYYIDNAWVDFANLVIVGFAAILFGREVLLGALNGITRKLSRNNKSI